MTTKQQRLYEVFTYLRNNGKVHTQLDFAEALRVTRPAVSAALNGKEAYLTTNLFQKICAAFPGVFNIDYLLNGEGKLILPDEQSPSQPQESQSVMDSETDIFRVVIKGKDDHICDLRKQLEASQMQVAEKDKIIHEEAMEIITLNSHVSKLSCDLDVAKRDIEQRDRTIQQLQMELNQRRHGGYRMTPTVSESVPDND